jgi:hypothetical protein
MEAYRLYASICFVPYAIGSLLRETRKDVLKCTLWRRVGWQNPPRIIKPGNIFEENIPACVYIEDFHVHLRLYF